MELARPWALLLLPALVLLWLSAQRWRERRPRPVTTWLLVERALSRLPSPPPARRFRLEDLWQLAPAALLVFALAGPHRRPNEDRGPLHVVADRSASMATRFEGNRTRLAAGLARLEADEEDVVVHGVPGPWHRGAVRQPTAAENDPSALAERAAELRAAGHRVLVLSDRDVPELAAGIGLLLMGEPAANAGITECALDAEGRLLVRARSTRRPRGSRLGVTVAVGGGPPLTRTAAEGEVSLRVVLPAVRPASSDRVVVRIDSSVGFPDANPFDDEVVLVPSARAVRVGFPPAGHDALHRAFSANPHTAVFRGSGPAALRVGPSGSADRFTLRVAPDLGIPSSRARALRGALGGELARDAADVFALAAVYEATLPASARVLLSLGGEPLLVRHGRSVWLLADPEGTGWPARPSFPKVFADLLPALGLEGRPGWTTHDGVGTFPVVGPGSLAVEWTDPAGRRAELTEDAEHRFALPFGAPGLYRLRSEGVSDRWFANAVLSSGETLNPNARQTREAAPPTGRGRAAQSLEPWLLIAAAALLLLQLRQAPALRSARHG